MVHVLGRLDRKAAVRVDRALRRAGGAAGVDDHHHVLGGGAFGGGLRGLAREGVLPEAVASLGHGHVVAPLVSVDEHVLDGRALADRLVGRFLHWNGISAAGRAVGRDERLGVGSLQARDDGPDAVAAEEGKQDAPNLDDGEEGDDDLRGHRHVEADAIPFAEAHLAERVGTPADAPVEFPVRQHLRPAVLALPPERFLVLDLRALPLVEQVVDDVHLAAGAPGRKGRAVGPVDDRVVVAVKLQPEVLDHRVPEPLQVAGRAGAKRVQVGHVVPIHERRQVGVGDDVGGRRPDDLLVEGKRV
jgi:hypothetical protein